MKLFRLIEIPAEDEGGVPAICIGIDLRIGDQQMTCPVTTPCKDMDALEQAQEMLEADLTRVIESGKTFLSAPNQTEALSGNFTEDTPPQDIWETLSRMEPEDEFIRQFNGLSEDQRMQVAEHVLTRCNIFQGRASLFAQRYDNTTALMG